MERLVPAEVAGRDIPVYFFTTAEVAQIMHCSTHYVTALRRKGFLKGTRVGRNWLYYRKDVEEMFDAIAGEDLSSLESFSSDFVKSLSTRASHRVY